MSESTNLSTPFQYLIDWAERTPERVLSDDGQQQLSFAEAAQYAVQIARRMRAIGVQAGDTVALELPGNLNVLFITAVMHEAAVSLSHSENAPVKADWLFSSARGSSALANRTVRVDSAFLGSLGTESTEPDPHCFDSGLSTLRITSSSGTTGTPKLIPINAAMAHDRALAAYELWQPGAAFLCILGIGSASGFHSLFGALMHGETYFVPDTAPHNFNLIQRNQIAAIKASPVQISELFDEASRLGKRLSSLRAIYSAGSTVPIALRHRIAAESDARLFNLYGSSEAGRAVEREISDDDLGFAGLVAPGTELQIVDAEGTPVAAGTTGSVRYRRTHQASEYLGNPKASAVAFVDGWFVPGDIGQLDTDGRLTLVGRNSELINAGGVKVSPVEIEHAAQQISTLNDVCAFGFADHNGVTQLGLAVVTDEGIDLRPLAQALKAQFGQFAPAAIVRMPILPRNAAGKIDRAAVSATYEQAISRS